MILDDLLQKLYSGEIVAYCFTGHRPDKVGGYDPKDNPTKRMVISRLIEAVLDAVEDRGVYYFITGMALGTDTWAAEVVLALKEHYPNIKLICAIPCENQTGVWKDPEDVAKWQKIVNKADYTYQITSKTYEEARWCLDARNEWMVDHSRGVIAVYDGSRGGTRNCLYYAGRRRRPVIRIRAQDPDMPIEYW